MVDAIPIHLIDYASEPQIAVLGGPLHRGYREYLAGRPGRCREIIAEFLASVYASRPGEISTEYFVREIYRERGIPMPGDRLMADRGIVLEAAERRYDRVHRLVLKSILDRGYVPSLGPAITVTGSPGAGSPRSEKSGRYRVGDGKNRCSILAALGRKTVPNVRIES